MSENHPAWVVLKFGGTSVASAANWHNIAGVIRARLEARMRPVVVHSALSGITDRLEALLTAALEGRHEPALESIETKHRELARSLDIVPGPRFEALIDELRRIAASIAETREQSDRLRARVMAMGELLATALGAVISERPRDQDAWVDARQRVARRATHRRDGEGRPTCRRPAITRRMRSCKPTGARSIKS